MMYKIMLFLPDQFITEGSDKNPEDCLRNVERKFFPNDIGCLTYRPADGTVYKYGHYLPCGIIQKTHKLNGSIIFQNKEELDYFCQKLAG